MCIKLVCIPPFMVVLFLMQLIWHVLSRKKKTTTPPPPPPPKKKKQLKKTRHKHAARRNSNQSLLLFLSSHMPKPRCMYRHVMPMILSACGYQNSNLHSTNTSSLTVFPGCIKILTDPGWAMGKGVEGWGGGGGGWGRNVIP